MKRTIFSFFFIYFFLCSISFINFVLMFKKSCISGTLKFILVQTLHLQASALWDGPRSCPNGQWTQESWKKPPQAPEEALAAWSQPPTCVWPIPLRKNSIKPQESTFSPISSKLNFLSSKFVYWLPPIFTFNLQTIYFITSIYPSILTALWASNYLSL